MRRAALLVGAMLAALVALSGVAWALTTVYCSDPANRSYGYCWGTDGDDEVIGRNKADHIFAGYGNDVVRAGKGADYIEGGIDLRRGKDVNYGGPGDDIVEGHQDAERHYGGGGDDLDIRPSTGQRARSHPMWTWHGYRLLQRRRGQGRRRLRGAAPLSGGRVAASLPSGIIQTSP
jgi:hypothetical protein